MFDETRSMSWKGIGLLEAVLVLLAACVGECVGSEHDLDGRGHRLCSGHQSLVLICEQILVALGRRHWHCRLQEYVGLVYLPNQTTPTILNLAENPVQDYNSVQFNPIQNFSAFKLFCHSETLST